MAQPVARSFPISRKPEQLEIARLMREDHEAQSRRDILKKPQPPSRRNRREARFHCEAPGDLAGGAVVRGARCLATPGQCSDGKLLLVAETERTASKNISNERRG